MKRLLVPFAAALSPAFILILGTQTTHANSATWKTSPATGDWNHAANWTPPTVPNGPSDTATFAASNTTDVSLSANTEVNGIVFNAGASPFTITVSGVSNYLFLTISGVGITNNSGIAQNFATTTVSQNVSEEIVFTNSATAGSGTFFTNTGGVVLFHDSSNAGNGTFINNDARVMVNGYTFIFLGAVDFLNTSTAGNGTFINNGGGNTFYGRASAGNGTFINNGSDGSSTGGFTDFVGHSSAGNGIFILNDSAVSGHAGGAIVFEGNSTADAATIIANDGLGGEGGAILFLDDARGGESRVAVFGKGTLYIASNELSSGVKIGSLEGDGHVLLGGRNLTVGSNHLDTCFSGVIQDGPFGDTGGSLTKIGSGKLVLRHRSTYPGGTVIERGKLMVNNEGGSATGSGPVQVDGGRLGGKGIIAGQVTVGTGNGPGATLSPGYVHGVGSPGALTIQSALRFNSDATYDVDVNSSVATADEVIAAGVTINSGAKFSFSDIGSGTLTLGTVFTVINNIEATPITGTFSNLPDGSTFTANGNTYQVSYEGGDGNDLTLTVIP